MVRQVHRHPPLLPDRAANDRLGRLPMRDVDVARRSRMRDHCGEILDTSLFVRGEA